MAMQIDINPDCVLINGHACPRMRMPRSQWMAMWERIKAWSEPRRATDYDRGWENGYAAGIKAAREGRKE